jgi:RimJ/RimL family protein N-acetyltransferase
LGFYAVANYAGQGYMSAGLKKLLNHFFNELALHRIEANIQPTNTQSIQLVKSNGFRYEGSSPHYLRINDIWQEHEHWAMTHEDFIKLNR